MTKGRRQSTTALRVRITANPEIAVGNVIGITFPCVRDGTAERMRIEVLMPANPAAALLAMLTKLKELGVLPELPGDVEAREP